MYKLKLICSDLLSIWGRYCVIIIIIDLIRHTTTGAAGYYNNIL